MLKLKKEMREVSAAASDQRAYRHWLIADYWWLITLIGGATGRSERHWAKGWLQRLGV